MRSDCGTRKDLELTKRRAALIAACTDDCSNGYIIKDNVASLCNCVVELCK